MLRRIRHGGPVSHAVNESKIIQDLQEDANNDFCRCLTDLQGKVWFENGLEVSRIKDTKTTEQ